MLKNLKSVSDEADTVLDASDRCGTIVVTL